MPIVVVRDEGNIQDMRGRILRGRRPGALTDDAVDSIRRANRNVDLDNLRRGTVLTIPEDVIGARDDVREDVREDVVATGVTAMVQTLTQAMKAASEEAREQADADQQGLATARQALDMSEVRDAARRDKSLAVQLKRLQGHLDEADGALEVAAAAREAAVSRWADDLGEVEALGEG